MTVSNALKADIISTENNSFKDGIVMLRQNKKYVWFRLQPEKN